MKMNEWINAKINEESIKYWWSAYSYGVTHTCLNCAALCYTFGRWEFARSTKHCMEFKMVNSAYEPSGQSGPSLSQFSWHETTKNIYTPPWMGCYLILGLLPALNSPVPIDTPWNLKGWTEHFPKTWTARPFSRRKSDPQLDFPFQRREGWSNCPLFFRSAIIAVSITITITIIFISITIVPLTHCKDSRVCSISNLYLAYTPC